MKKVLLATTALVLSGGIAAAEVMTSGNGRMGVIESFGGDLEFTSRIRIEFSGSGETEGGLAFAGSIRADNAVGGNAGTAGEVSISSGGLSLAMGDVDGGAKAAVGHVGGVGLTGIGDLNESTYIANAGDVPAALVTYATDAFSVYVSASNPGDATADGDNYGLGVSAALGDISVALGYEMADEVGAATDVDHIIAGVSADLGAVALAAIYGTADGTGIDGDQYAVSVTVPLDPVSVTAFFTDDSELGGAEAYGIGFVYGLGGADLKGGYVSNETTGDDAFDFGISFSF